MNNLTWKRSIRDDTDCAQRKVHESHCGGYRVIEQKGKFAGILNGFIAMKLRVNLSGGTFWDTIEKPIKARKTFKEAVALCEQDYG